MDHIWENLRTSLSKIFAKPLYELYIEHAKPISFDRQLLTISVSEPIHLQMWQDHILDSATIYLKNEFPDAEIRIVLERDLQPTFFQPEPPSQKVNLNVNYTFDNFIVGEGNKLAYTAALIIAESPGKIYNPLFFYGGSGLGKTHLMHAIGNKILTRNPSANIKYVTSETFTNEFINSLQQKKNPEEFRNRYRNVDLLLVDDIQFLAHKESTLEEFFHTFNELHESGKQIVLTSDRLASEIPELPERLVSRFGSGLSSDITPPDLETRTAILKNKALNNQIDIPDDVLGYIAGQVSSNVRDLEAALNRVNFYSITTKKEITTSLAAEALQSIISSPEAKSVSIYDIQIAVGKLFNVTIEQLQGKQRKKEIVVPRQIAMYLSRELTNHSLPKIGDEFGGKDHTTVMHAYDKIQQAINENSNIELVHQIEQLRKKLS